MKANQIDDVGSIKGRSKKGLAGDKRIRSLPSPIYPNISVVVAIHDERECLAPLYCELARSLAGKRWELILVDDGSSDGSFEEAEKLHCLDSRVAVIKFRRNFGKTAALSAGISAARGGTIVTIDGDLQDDPREIPRLLEALDSGYDLITGWRQKRRDPLSKRISSAIFNRVVSLLTGVRLHDINCGLKAMRSDAAKDLKLYGELHRFIPVLASQKGYKVGEVGVQHRPRRHGRSKYGWGRALAALLDIQTVLFLTRYLGKPLRLFGSVGLLLLGLGVILGGYLTLLWFQGHEIGRRPLLSLSVLLVISGLQFFSTGLIGEMLRNVSFSHREEYSVDTFLTWELPSEE